MERMMTMPDFPAEMLAKSKEWEVLYGAPPTGSWFLRQVTCGDDSSMQWAELCVNFTNPWLFARPKVVIPPCPPKPRIAVGMRVSVRDGSYSYKVWGGELKEGYGIDLACQTYRVAARGGPFPTYTDRPWTPLNDSLLIGERDGATVFIHSSQLEPLPPPEPEPVIPPCRCGLLATLCKVPDYVNGWQVRCAHCDRRGPMRSAKELAVADWAVMMKA